MVGDKNVNMNAMYYQFPPKHLLQNSKHWLLFPLDTKTN